MIDTYYFKNFTMFVCNENSISILNPENMTTFLWDLAQLQEYKKRHDLFSYDTKLVPSNPRQ